MLLGKTGGPRWARGQKFSLSTLGLEADAGYRAAVAGARGVGRAALDSALAGWAAPLGVAAQDGVVLGELREKPRGLPELTSALEDAGIPTSEVRLALDRLVKGGLVDLVPLASQRPPEQATRPPPRW